MPKHNASAGTVGRVHCVDRDSLSKPSGTAVRTSGGRPAGLLGIALLAPAVLLVGCGSGADLVSSVALQTEQNTDFVAGVGVPDAPETGAQSAAVNVTPVQREYLSALSSAGVRPSSDIRALSIGSYVCQARSAGQTEQAVWDYVAPMVRSDVADAQVTSPGTPPSVEAAAIASYIRIATERLC